MLESLRTGSCVCICVVLLTTSFLRAWKRVCTDICSSNKGEISLLVAERTITSLTDHTHSTEAQLWGLHTPEMINYSRCSTDDRNYQSGQRLELNVRHKREQILLHLDVKNNYNVVQLTAKDGLHLLFSKTQLGLWTFRNLITFSIQRHTVILMGESWRAVFFLYLFFLILCGFLYYAIILNKI